MSVFRNVWWRDSIEWQQDAKPTGWINEIVAVGLLNDRTNKFCLKCSKVLRRSECFIDMRNMVQRSRFGVQMVQRCRIRIGWRNVSTSIYYIIWSLTKLRKIKPAQLPPIGIIRVNRLQSQVTVTHYSHSHSHNSIKKHRKSVICSLITNCSFN
jgi:hypothetical protein